MFSATVMSGISAGCWCTIAIPRSWASAGVRLSKSSLASTIVPLSGAIAPDATFINVDFPAPFSPSSACTSPGRTSNETSVSAAIAPKCFVMPSIDNVGGRSARSSGGSVETMDSFSTIDVRGSGWVRPREPPHPARLRFLLLHQLRLDDRRQLRREVDVARESRPALDPIRLAGYGVLEHERGEVRAGRLLPARRQGDRPVDCQPRVIVLRRDRVELERRVACHVLLPEAPENVAVRRREGRDFPTALRELRKRADERRAEVRDDDVDLRVLGDRG